MVESDDGCPLCGGGIELVVVVDVTSSLEQLSPSQTLAVARCQLCNEQLHRPQGESRWQSRKSMQKPSGQRLLP